jgi:cysteine desulfuration protein SufE
MTSNILPTALAVIRDDFLALAEPDRLQLLLEFSEDLPALPERYLRDQKSFERVEECQSPVFILADVDEQRTVHLHVIAPQESPTTRGFASVLAHGLDGLTVLEMLALPDDLTQTLGLGKAVSPLRIRGMTALLGRAKRQVRGKTAL